jgi:hypothetical protein
MNLFASCPRCKLSLQLLPPSKEIETRLLMNSTEISPLMLSDKARWLSRCPDCQAEFVVYGYPEEGKIDSEVLASVKPLQEYRELRERNLRESGWHLGEMLRDGFFPGCLLSGLPCIVAGLFFSSINNRRDLIMFPACSMVLFLLPVAFLSLLKIGKIVVFELITSGLGALVLTSVWFLIAWLVSSIHLLLVFGAMLPCWMVSMHFIRKRVQAQALLAVEQELLQLELLPVMPQYWVGAKASYR